MDHRECVRHLVRLPISIINHDGTKHYKDITKDLSETGLSILYPHNAHITDDVTILLSLHGQLIEIVGRFVYTVYSSEDQTFRTGISFKSFKHNGRKKLLKFLNNRPSYS